MKKQKSLTEGVVGSAWITAENKTRVSMAKSILVFSNAFQTKQTNKNTRKQTNKKKKNIFPKALGWTFNPMFGECKSTFIWGYLKATWVPMLGAIFGFLFSSFISLISFTEKLTLLVCFNTSKHKAFTMPRFSHSKNNTKAICVGTKVPCLLK